MDFIFTSLCFKFITYAFTLFYRYAAEHGVIIVNPDTSPRGLGIPGDSDSWDFGEGAGFYVDAKKEPWKANYRMFSYITSELVEFVNEHFPVVKGKQAIMGHRLNLNAFYKYKNNNNYNLL